MYRTNQGAGGNLRSRHPRSTEWMQALMSFGVLMTILISVQGSGTLAGSGETSVIPSGKPIGYWSQNLGYGFASGQGDTFIPLVQTSDAEKIAVQSRDGEVYRDADVRVSYYSDHTVDSVAEKFTSDQPRSYSQLPHGVAVIEGDLSSARAKMVLATLHSR